ncbi:hypothetical protein BDD43_1049 [Mucilaginibacter gracilis]|uniref:Uncharacterized protein n=1 Tax=Mucilaginibacter gracilis TaxID=423350 RepID=A0A495IWE4_9SPHI|nr:hypothetical protein [Mucilaginibacter gracilis]RKR80912.1 hypothetical protein BDD43_1049 [Mucilaginibacter gracilis]
MDTEAKKKLIIPVLVFLGVLAINTNTIINAVKAHDTTRTVIASGSTVIVLMLLIVVIRRAVNGAGSKPPEA